MLAWHWEHPCQWIVSTNRASLGVWMSGSAVHSNLTFKSIFLIRGSSLSLYTDVQQYNVVLVAATVKNKNRVHVWPHPLIQRKHRKSFACSCVYDMHAHAHCGRWSIEILTAMSQSHHMRIAVGDLYRSWLQCRNHITDMIGAGLVAFSNPN